MFTVIFDQKKYLATRRGAWRKRRKKGRDSERDGERNRKREKQIPRIHVCYILPASPPPRSLEKAPCFFCCRSLPLGWMYFSLFCSIFFFFHFLFFFFFRLSSFVFRYFIFLFSYLFDFFFLESPTESAHFCWQLFYRFIPPPPLSPNVSDWEKSRAPIFFSVGEISESA